jgi:hypothetical protein
LNTAQAQGTSSWATWNNPGSFPLNSGIYDYAPSTTGSLTLPDLSTVNLTVSGEVASWDSTFGPTTGATKWDSYPAGTFTSANVPSLPSNGDYIFEGGYGNPTESLTFSRPVQNITMNIWSLGSPNTVGAFQFDQPFVVLSQDPRAGQNFSVNGNILSGAEASGTIEFTGTFTTFSWTVASPEWGFGWNIGASSASALTPVPEPSTVAFGVMGLSALLFRRRK